LAKPTPPPSIPIAMGCGGSKNKVERAEGEAKDAAASDDSAAKQKQLAPSLSKDGLGANKEENKEDIRDKYELGEILGSGSFGQVREAKLKENPSEVRAVKMIEPDKGDGEWSNQAIFVREVGLLQEIKHENIIRYYDFYEDIHFLYVVMELCRGGEVFAKIVELKRFREKDAAMIGQQMLKSLDYCHKLCIAHRDVKAENFMLSSDSIQSRVKMIDFGMATKFKPDQILTELCGSPHYLSPELIGQKYNHLADVWAFGVLLYLLMYGHYPYDAKHPRDIMVKILTEPIKWQSKAKLSKDAIKFLTGLLEHDIRKRLSAEGALEHPWMKKVNSVGGDDGQLLCPDVVRSAHQKATLTKKELDPQIDMARNQKLNAIDEDFKVGIRHGKRLGATPKEEYMSKPEFVRRENKITTAPSQNVGGGRRESFQKLIGMFGGGRGRSGSQVVHGGIGPITEDGDAPLRPLTLNQEPKAKSEAPPAVNVLGPIGESAPRAPSKDLGPKEGAKEPEPKAKKESTLGAGLTAPGAKAAPRRLSYLVGITPQDEKSFEALFKEKRDGSSVDASLMSPLMPTAETGGPGLPGASPEEAEE